METSSSRGSRNCTTGILPGVRLLRRKPALGALFVLTAALFGQTAGEFEVKAAFLTKFPSFVEWPAESASGPICIGVLGQDPFGGAIERLIREQPGARQIVVRRMKNAAESRPCQIIFISASEKKNLRTLLSRFRGRPVLTVGDTPGFCENGGIINLELSDNRVRLQVNVEAAARAHIQISSKLLTLATIIRDSGSGQEMR